ncbi:MAG: NAD-dependent epimerase/dehydratase family protein [Gaiellaceae bacterium]
MDRSATVLVTGATGFIGGRVVEAMHLSGAAAVRAGIRSWSSAARIARFCVPIVACDVLRPHQLSEAMSGVDVVVHCAAGSEQTIVAGTCNVLEAARQQGVRRVVHLSTAEVYGNCSGTISEDRALTSVGVPYVDAKIEAEALCSRASERGDAVTVLRPSIVYGPFGQSYTVDIARRLKTGKWGRFAGRADGRCNLIYVDDLVRAILLTARSERAAGEAFNLVGPDELTWNEYFERFNAALGLPQLRELSATRARTQSALVVPLRAVGSSVLRRFEDPILRANARSRLLNGVFKRARVIVDTAPTPNQLDRLYPRRAHYSAAKAEELLGYTPTIDLDAGLAMSTRWLAHHRLT